MEDLNWMPIQEDMPDEEEELEFEIIFEPDPDLGGDWTKFKGEDGLKVHFKPENTLIESVNLIPEDEEIH